MKPAIFHPGQQLCGERGGSFRILEWVGEGSYARVYRAVGGDQLVALKLAKAEVNGARERLRAEKAAHRDLKHSAIPAFVDGDPDAPDDPCDTESTWMVRQWVEGDTLARRFDAGRALPLVQAVPALLRVADALAAIHHAGWIHGDVRPQNILLEVDTNLAFLFDLGEARPYGDTGGGSPASRGVRRSLTSVIRPRPVSQPGAGASSSPSAPPAAGPVSPERDVQQLGKLLAWTLTGTDPHLDPDRLSTTAGYHPIVVRLWQEIRCGHLSDASAIRDSLARLARQLGLPALHRRG